MPGKIAKKNERVVVNRDFSVVVPEGYAYSTTKNEINDNRKLVFIKTERNEIFDKEYGDFDEYGLDSPFAAPQCFTVMEPRSLGLLDLSDANVRAAIKNMATQFMTMFGGTCATIKEDNDILVYFSKFKGKETNTHFMIVTSENLYNGQIWINDVSTQKSREQLAKEWLMSAQNYIMTDADKKPRKPFVSPTYNDGKKAQMGKLTVPIPDDMITLSEFVEGTDLSLGSIMDTAQMIDQYALLSITKKFEDGFHSSHEAPCSIECENSNVHSVPGLAELWETDAANIKKTLTSVVEQNLQSQGREGYTIHYKKLGDKFAVVYSQVGESTDAIEYWCTYMAYYFYDGDLIAPMIFINAKEDKPAFEKFVENWILAAKPATEEEIAQYEKAQAVRALGVLAGKNGKIDGPKGTQLFFEDVFFFVKGQIQANGRHNELKGLQVNAQAIDNYPQVKSNLDVFGKALTDLINFVEQDELLILDEECVHHAFDELNKIDPPIINGTPVNVKGTKIGKGLSGTRIFLLIAWHMIKIVTTDESTYIVALDQNIFKGIPNAVAYVLQLIKRLREYNGLTGEFGAVFASTYNMDGGIDGPISGKNPLACRAAMDAVKVKEGENPYEVVLQEIAEAKKKGVWKEWDRGRNAGDDFDDDFDDGIIPDLSDFDIDAYEDEHPMPEVDKKGRIAPTDVKTSAKVKKAIKDIGDVGKTISLKGKVFVLTEVEYPDILEKYIIQNGGEVKSSTVLTTDYLIIGDNGSGDTGKAKRALELNKTRGKNIKALSENDFWRMVSDEYIKAEKKARKVEEEKKKEAERIRKEKEAAERKAAEEERKRIAAEAKAKYEAAMKLYTEEHQKWESECAEISKKRESFVDERVSAERTTLIAAAKKKRDDTVANANAIIAEQTQRRNSAESTLATLGIFKFADKKAQKAIIEDASSKITDAKLSISTAETTYTAEIESIEQKVKNKVLSFHRAASKEFPLPEEPKKPVQ